MYTIDETAEGKLALAFVQHLADGQYEAAHSLLTPMFGATVPASELQKQYESMISYGKGPATRVWDATRIGPGDLDADFGWVYVNVMGEDWLEGVMVMITRAGQDLLIRDIVWRRP